MPSYILDPWFPATVSSSFSYTLTVDLGQVDRCLNLPKVILLVDSLYAEAIEAVKARAALSASTLVLISNLEDIKSEARL
jgi:hypothetical protein